VSVSTWSNAEPLPPFDPAALDALVEELRSMRFVVRVVAPAEVMGMLRTTFAASASEDDAAIAAVGRLRRVGPLTPRALVVDGGLPIERPEPGDDLPAWTCRVYFNDGTTELVRVR
jgi:hypothetical protein